MTDPTAIPPDPAPNLSSFTEDLSSPTFQFDTTIWKDAPPFVPRDIEGNEVVSRRNANHAIYRQIGNATAWHRYVTLGYYAIDDCMIFDKEWKKFGSNPLIMYQIIWYNYLYHVDRMMEIPPKLYAWATAIAQPYLQQNNPALLQMETLQKDWSELKTSPGTPGRDGQGEWIPVTPRRGRSSKNHQGQTTPPPFESGNTGRSSVSGFNLPPDDNTLMPDVPMVANDSDVINPPDTRPDHTSIDVNMANVPWFNSNEEESTEKTDAPRPPPLAHVSTNDGTHRLTIRWSLINQEHGDLKKLESNKDILDTAIHKLMTHIFDDQDGQFYRWESSDLIHFQKISQMTPTMIRDYITPVVTFVHSRNQLIFGVRFSFCTSPAGWRTSEKAQLLKEANLNVAVSNSISSSGKLVIAGYILVKAPNTTHRHRYVQHLMRQLPESTPYFDVVRLSKSPTDQVIPHLAIQCGEKHVTPLCQALSNYLTGENRALFIPRYALSTMSEEKLTQRFEFHKNWCRSSVAISMSPTVAHIDQPRREYFPDGTTLIRSAREWVETLMFPDESYTYCDIVNGTSDRKTLLYVPRQYHDMAKIQWQAYKKRLYPPSHREARFRDSLTGLPSEIQISTEVNTNLDRFDSQSAADIWSQAPASVRERPRKEKQPPKPGSGKHKRAQGKERRSDTLFSLNTSVGSITSVPESDSEADDETDRERSSVEAEPLRRNTAAQGGSLLDIHVDNTSNASTHSLTRGSMTTAQARFREVEAILERQKLALATQTRKSDERLSAIERQLNRLDQIENKMEEVGTYVRQATNAQQITAQDLRADIRENAESMATQQREHREYCDEAIGKLSTSVVTAMDGLLKMQQDFAALSTYLMQGLATIPSPLPKRRKHRTFEETDDTFMELEHKDSSETMVFDDAPDDIDYRHAPVNLEATFNRTDESNEQVTTAVASTLPASPQHYPAFHPLTTPNQISTDEHTTHPSLAPLDPRNTENTGSAGANDK